MSLNLRRFGPIGLLLLLSVGFFFVFLLISGLLFFNKGTGSLMSREKVGVIEVKGVISDSKKILKWIEQAKEDDQVKALVIRLNSPGGAVAPSQEIYEAVRKFPKPTVASMGSVAASGAYYISVAAKKIYANPGTLTGSIGVIMEFANLKRLYEWAKVERYSIKTGKFKDAGAEYREMTEDEKKYFQEVVGDVLEQFKSAILAGRKLKPEQVDALADGRVFSGNQAKKLGLIDHLGTLEDAVEEAAKMAKIQGKPKTLYFGQQRKGLVELFQDPSIGERLREIFQGTGILGESPGLYWIWHGSHS